YGDRPDWIMKATLHPKLGGMVFVRYCVPIAIASYLVVARHLEKQLKGQKINVDRMDVVDANAEDVRFLQATRHGEVMTPVELVEDLASELEGRADAVIERLRQGEPLGLALVHEDISVGARRLLLGVFVSEELADGLDRHYL